MKAGCIFLVVLLLVIRQGYSQQQPADAQLKVIMQLPDDTSKVNKLNALAGKTFAANPELTISLLNTAIEISERIHYPLGAAAACGIRASMLIYEMKLDSSLLMLNKAYALVKDGKEVVYINQQANLHNKYGAVFQQKQQYDAAIKKYLLAADLYRQTNNEQLSIVGYYNISVMYGLLDEQDKSLYYARQVRHIAIATGNAESILRSYIVLGDAFAGAQQYDSLLYNIRQGLAVADLAHNPFIAGKLYQQTGIYNLKGLHNYGTAIKYFDSSLVQFEKVNLPYEMALVYQNLGNTYLQQKDYINAEKFATKAVDVCKPLGMDELMLKSLSDLAAAAENSGQVNKSLQYLKEYVALHDTLEQRTKSKIVHELEAKYQSQKREALLLAQQNTIDRKNTLNYILIGSAATLLIISLLSYRTYAQKQLLQQQRINELEKEKQLTATEAVLRGEEQERTRLAKDLHDGLGGMLSGIKYSFQSMQGNMVMTPENLQSFERSMDMLNSSIKEMRRVAHNLMPEVLVKFGLDAALRDFCNDINQSGALVIAYQSPGLENTTMDQTSAITIYRIVQELINNIIKHAAAKSAIVQVSKTGERIAITVEDDGKGFDPVILQQVKGIGWSNITSRIKLMKGTSDIQSAPGNGTSVHIEMTIG